MANGELIGATSKRYDGKGRDDRRSLGEVILAKRNRGEKMYGIAAELNISEPTARAYMKLALDARIPPTVDEYRRQMNDQLDTREAMMIQQIDALDAMLMSPDLTQTLALNILAERRQTVATLARLDERRAKLNGTDSPVRADVTVHNVDANEAELQEMMNEARAKAAREKTEQTDAVR